MRLGLTGGIGCGKSTVVACFARLGWQTIESDAIVRDLLATDAALAEALAARWGEQCQLPEGGIDRRAVASIVFQDKTELKWLEGQLHPRVREVWKGQLAANPAANHLVEIPLLFEKSLESEFDFTVCVTCPEATVESRMKARGFSKEELARRRSHQMPIGEKMRRADFVITNAGSPDFLEPQIRHLLATANP